MLKQKTNHGSVYLNNKVYVTGGNDMLDIFYSTEIYDFITDKWEFGPELNASKVGHAMI